MNENKAAFKIFKKTGILCILFLAIFSVVFLLLNFFFNIIVEVFKKTFATGSLLKPKEINIDFSLFTSFSLLTSSLIAFLCITGISLATTIMLIYKFKTNYGQLKKDQKGSARFTTFKEIQQQYRDVPDKRERFKGGGGIPIARYKDRLFVDDSPVNNMIIGTTRSGKGETLVFSAIDIYSRAENQASMILNDPKGELYSASKETLEGLGYHVEVLNLMNPNQSMSYDLLEIVKKEFLSKNYSQAQQYARSLSFMLYHDPTASDKVWSNASTNLCTALILGLCEVNKKTPERINMYNLALMLSDLTSQTVEDEDGNEEEGLVEFFKQFPPNHPARLQFATYEGSKGNTRASILMNTTTPLGIFTLDGIGKLTSCNSLDMEKVGFNHWLRGKAQPFTRVHFNFPNGKNGSVKTDEKGYFHYYHDNHLEVGQSFEITVGKSDQSTVYTVQSIDEKGNIDLIQDNKITRITSAMQFEKPIAVFMIVPDYDETFNVIASLYVKQLYTTLARAASNVPSGKCFREVIFMLDEFGNMPPIEGMTNIITVCLGRNIRFNLIIQAYSQLEELYGKSWKTINGNCGNTLYLLTSDEDTAEAISKKLGDKTIDAKSRSGQRISLSKSITESVDSRRLMTATEVMGLKEGEMIVIRVIKRQDKNRKRIKSHPIYLTGETALKYRWEYLADYYDTDKSINDIDIPCEHSIVDLNDLKTEYLLMEDSEEQEISLENKSEDRTESILMEEQEIVPNIVQSVEKPLLEKEVHGEVIRNTKREIALKRQKDRIEKNRKEQELHKKINGLLKASQVIPEGLMMQAFNGEVQKVEEYSDMGILDFRDVVISENSEINDKICSLMLSKINYALEQMENDVAKGSIVNG